MANPKPLCRFIGTPRGCFKGAKCRFSHDLSGNGQGHQRVDTKSNRKDKLSEPGTPLSIHVQEEFFRDAYSLVASDPVNMQSVIKALASEGGSKRVLHLVKSDAATLATRGLIDSTLFHFFKAISHPDVLASALLEPFVGTIYNTVFGYRGQHAIKLFTLISSEVEKLSIDQLEAVVAVFSNILDLNGDAPLIQEFKDIAKKFQAAAESIQDAQADLTTLNICRWVKRAQRRVGLVDLTSSVAYPSNDSHVSRADFPFHVDAPGSRHDNDHEDIRKIRILPTFNEILSERAPYLPVMDPTHHHATGMAGLIDRHFRLYREDVLKPIRMALRAQLVQPLPCNLKIEHLYDIRTYTYKNVEFQRLHCDIIQGLAVTIGFDQPYQVTNLSPQTRQSWWEDRKRLQKDALVCIIDQAGYAIFCTVAVIKDDETSTFRDLVTEPYRASVTVVPAEEKDLEVISNYFTGLASSEGLRLVEFPSVLLGAFQPTLAALKALIGKQDLPFADLLAPSDTASGVKDVGAPIYAQQQGFRFNLDCLRTTGPSLSVSITEDFDFDSLINGTTLDRKQAEALVHALSNRLALCQGPPGTGKSFTGVALTKVLLSNKSKAELGPILVVTNTNHALDQILEHLLDNEISRVVRIGSRSQSERLQNLNLRVVSKQLPLTDVEQTEQRSRYRSLAECSKEVDEIAKELNCSDFGESIKTYLNKSYPEYYDQFWGADEDGFEYNWFSADSMFHGWVTGHWNLTSNHQSQRTRKQLTDQNVKVWAMSVLERQEMYEHWIREWQDLRCKMFQSAVEDHRKAKIAWDASKQELDLRCLKEADIIGLTTSGLARNIELLKRLPIKILLIEEAGEVLEAHTLTALLPSVEHAILIGDHLQLKPSVANFQLSSESSAGKKYSLDMSLFERLVDPPRDAPSAKLPYVTLNTQRRMHPAISALMRFLYPKIEDAPNVFQYPPVAGMKKNMYWLHHDQFENEKETNEVVATSKSNDFEVEMTACLVAHLLAQGVYEPKEIAVITPYMGQLSRLRQRLSDQYEIVLNDRDAEALEEISASDTVKKAPQAASLLQSLKVASVDNFQGEEAKVVIISLVRSNEINKVGFLKTYNRINVLLSRAMHGMYILGNSKMYAPNGQGAHEDGETNSMWAYVLGVLEAGNNLGPTLPLCCPRHPKTTMEVASPDDFQRFSPEGGCALACARRLGCGHPCMLKCHSNLRHDNVKCLEPCPRLRSGCKHLCRKVCGDDCDPQCNEILYGKNLTLPCGHVVENLRCWEFQHQDSILCKVLVEKKAPKCGHIAMVNCHINIQSDEYLCQADCGGQLKCGHLCNSSCWQCGSPRGSPQDRKHKQCTRLCERPYTHCSHTCGKQCHGGTPCQPCSQRCTVACSHSQCNLPCAEPCVPCAKEHCSSRCPHSQCSMPCAAPCDWIPCSKRCSQVLACSHQCPSLCGEPCPDSKFCPQCANDSTKALTVEYLEMRTLGDIDTDELSRDPLIVPPCGHPILMSSLDGHMNMSAFYNMNGDGSIEALKPSEPFSSGDDTLKSLPRCIVCRGSLRSIGRYGRIIQRSLLDDGVKRFVTWASTRFGELTEQFNAAQDKLKHATITPTNLNIPNPLAINGSRDAQFKTIDNLTREWSRYRNLKMMRRNSAGYFARVNEKETPFARVWALTELARLRTGRAATFDTKSTVSLLSFHVLALALLIRCDMVLLADVLKEFDKFRKGPFGLRLLIDLSENRKDCEQFIKRAIQAKDDERTVEGHIFFAYYAAMELRFAENGQDLKAQGEDHIRLAHELCKRKGERLQSLVTEVKDAERALSGGTFMQPISSAERRQVLAAMMKEFRGTGHWYECVNGHPFSVGECGMPMQLSRCPHCGEAIGGQQHRPADGVTRADELERELTELHLH
ncbi:hypothetical protein EJ04DRAFT_544890 [Polyplosphaeria fusca]|uniref:NFX1-type zinc finger-containing protein 1 n=1 Tax=Polyplosphaeria fusca TaxID=682080 RepID=A0A9P4QQQ7_9PLEO|nr:hypothetical protein EJ04DRAFT_544890 [Polyplosphaeria fusca]